ncbi:PREDICTED: stress response protein NST1-like [Prunus mume]|uniref:Stress response protein NST1-like n=1 Tax=Prunus mume TaxID=102107 RepID=A0ABM0N5H5_PRUMU|nr:PREDICTED: stress response protein NST1-like [Prunus mume]
MVGGGSRRDEGSLVINNTNVFAALETLRKKKKSDKDRKSKGSSKSAQSAQPKAPEAQVFWAPAPLNAKSWADVDDEDDDDYYATTAPPQSVWGPSEPQQNKDRPNVEDSESEEDILDEGDDDVEEEHDNEPEVPVNPEPVLKKPADVPAPPKEAERQLSKKEKKKKELAELEALLADFGVTQKESDSQDESRGAAQEKDSALNGDGEKKENQPAESKSAKKKKKKDKASKEVKESQDQPNNSGATNGQGEVTAAEQTEEDTSNVDVKERLKKVVTAKKKKSSKEMDAAAKAASQEAAARRARLAAAKKKEKNHYNQQPVR